jgi:hypothetical protein
MVTAKGLNDAKARTTVSLYLKDSALRWYISLEDDFKGDYDALKEAFQRRFEPDHRTKWQRTVELYFQFDLLQPLKHFVHLNYQLLLTELI